MLMKTTKAINLLGLCSMHFVLTGHVYVFTVAFLDDVVCLTIGETFRLHVVL